MDEEIIYDHRRGTLTPDARERILRSRREVEGMSKRVILCPICGFPMKGAYSDNTGHAHLKCQKCKLEGPFNLAYFRRSKRYMSRDNTLRIYSRKRQLR